VPYLFIVPLDHTNEDAAFDGSQVITMCCALARVDVRVDVRIDVRVDVRRLVRVNVTDQFTILV
jgi:hypothetical protein